MSVLLLDTETTGLDFEKDRIIEIAVRVVSDDFKTDIAHYNHFVWDESYPELSPEITKITGITEELIKSVSFISPGDMVKGVESVIKAHAARGIVAYNAEFDRNMLNAERSRQNGGVISVPYQWVCAMRDLESNREYKCWKLSHLSLDRGIAVNPRDLHRAMDDVCLMQKMLIAAGATYTDLLAYRDVPDIIVCALVAHPREARSEQERDIAKKAGYSWQQVKNDPRVFEKRWVKKIKQTDLEKEKASCPLTIRVI